MAKIDVQVSVKDAELFKKLSEITVYLLEKAEPDARTEAIRRLVEASIIEDPAKKYGDRRLTGERGMTRDEVLEAFNVPSHIANQLEAVEVPDHFKEQTIEVRIDGDGNALLR